MPKLHPFWWFKAAPYYPKIPHLLLTEYWNFGPPSVYTLIHTESWNYPNPPTYTLIFTEEWSS